MTFQRCKHDYVININKWYINDSESYTHSWSIQFITQKSWNHSWKRKFFKHWKDATYVESVMSLHKMNHISVF